MLCTVALPSTWVNSSRLEDALRRSGDLHRTQANDVQIRIPVGCKVMVDAAIRLLSLVNQLDVCTRRVRLDFEEGQEGTMGYLNRVGFFDHLAPNVEVLPERPEVSGAELYRGNSVDLVEIARINKDHRDETLPTRLADALMCACGSRTDANELKGAAWTIFAELIDNIFSHSETPLDGYAALQVYKRGGELKVAVSDSGLGIMQTLRPALKTEFPKLATLSDVELVVEIFRQGLSRHGTDRGCGLKGSASKAIKFKANLDVRLPTNRILLTPAAGIYEANTAYCFDQLPLIWGTHICFDFRLNGQTIGGRET